MFVNYKYKRDTEMNLYWYGNSFAILVMFWEAHLARKAILCNASSSVCISSVSVLLSRLIFLNHWVIWKSTWLAYSLYCHLPFYISFSPWSEFHDGRRCHMIAYYHMKKRILLWKFDQSIYIWRYSLRSFHQRVFFLGTSAC